MIKRSSPLLVVLLSMAAFAQTPLAPQSHRLSLLAGEASLTQVTPPSQLNLKPEGEIFDTVDLIEQRITFSSGSPLPESGEVRIDFIAQNDAIDRVSLFSFGVIPNELSFEFSRDGESWGPTSVRTFVDGTFNIPFQKSRTASRGPFAAESQIWTLAMKKRHHSSSTAPSHISSHQVSAFQRRGWTL